MNVERIPSHAFIALTVALTVYSQLVLRWQMSQVAAPSGETAARLLYYAGVLLRPWILSAMAATFVSGLSWMAALNRFPLSYAFPYMALNFVLVMIGSALFFAEPVTPQKIAGNTLIILGVVLLAR
jgi:drug/metabolite transporter (DMT)-like permease